MLKVRGHLLDVDYSEELEDHLDQFHRMRIRGNKLQACSPFRYEKNPSFAVNLENGTWVDSGSDDESSRKGSFVSLLAFLRHEDQDETCEYLLDKYLHILDDVETLELKLEFLDNTPQLSILKEEKYNDVVNIVTDYLSSRGISEEVQRYFQTGQGKKGDCIAIPWHDEHGRIINIKYRSINNKEFWFSKGGQPIKRHVFGLFAVREQQIKTVWVVESEIDCLYLWTLGIPSVAFGGAAINDVQKNLLLKTDIECLVIATDNDTVGHRFADVLKDEFMGIYQVKRLIFPNGKKDVNELMPSEVMACEIKELGFNF